MSDDAAFEPVLKDLLDEILFRDPPDAINNSEVINGITKLVEVVTFMDGSKLAIAAQVPLPPLGDMTPERVYFIKPSGERGESLDDGSSEARKLAKASIAVRLMARISKILDEMPSHAIEVCPQCHGKRGCKHCSGLGCRECAGTGICPECQGRGVIPQDQ